MVAERGQEREVEVVKLFAVKSHSKQTCGHVITSIRKDILHIFSEKGEHTRSNITASGCR